ncbi:PilZ domain-containing protein [Kiloniella majae]|uniref:PilZ domain-containing protein n=1 Tax=Kiloniella majae TaxID=1938558 RepID=UPI000A277C7A|nr:PilZ domain-containing protein [Kiloniella majae]
MIKNLLDKLFGKKEIRREGREFGVTGTVAVKGVDYSLDNWSSSGYAITGYDGPLLRGDHVDIHFRLELDGGALEFDCKSIIVRIEPDKETLAGVFVEMSPETRILIANYFDS